MATLATPIDDVDTLFDPNAVKVVRARRTATRCTSAARRFRGTRDAFAQRPRAAARRRHWLRHIGIYAYRAGFLRRFAAMPPGRLEQIESLEQLRVLEAGFRIAVAPTPEPFPPGVDTPEDLARAEARLAPGRLSAAAPRCRPAPVACAAHNRPHSASMRVL